MLTRPHTRQCACALVLREKGLDLNISIDKLKPTFWKYQDQIKFNYINTTLFSRKYISSNCIPTSLWGRRDPQRGWRLLLH
jgi:hypothetical protein